MVREERSECPGTEDGLRAVPVKMRCLNSGSSVRVCGSVQAPSCTLEAITMIKVRCGAVLYLLPKMRWLKPGGEVRV